MTNPDQFITWTGGGTISEASNTPDSLYEFVSLAAGGIQPTWAPTSTTPAPQPAPQPAPSTPQEFAGHPADHYFADYHHRNFFTTKRVSQINYNKQTRPPPWWTEADELQLVNKLYMEWFNEMYDGDGNGDWTTKSPTLELDKIEPKIIQKRHLPPFKIDYQTFNEVRLRLLNTVILINGSPFYVGKIREKNNGFILGVFKGDREMKTVMFKDLQDLRSIPGMYLTTASTGWLCRIPGRVYQQGVNRNNTQFRTVNGKSVLFNLDPLSMINAIDKRQDRTWHHTYEGLMKDGELQAVRLSDDIAVQGTKAEACYRGRVLGCIKDGEILCEDEDDLLQGWIEKAAKNVGLEMQAA